MNFGVSQQHKDILIAIFEKHLPSGKVIIYGSRAKGSFTQRSDIDLVIKHSNSIDRNLLEEIREAIEESDFPYLADIKFFETIISSKLIEHIKRVGKVFYEK